MHISRGIYICIFISILSLLLRTIGLKSETFGTRWLRDGKILSRTDDYIFIFNILVVSRGKENECFKYVLIEKRWIQLYEDFLRNGYGKKKSRNEFSICCSHSNAANLNIVAFFISVLQLFPYQKRKKISISVHWKFSSIFRFVILTRWEIIFETIYNFASCRIFPWKIIINNYFDCLLFNSNVSDENVRAAVVPSERNHLHEQWGTERWWDEMRREKGLSNRCIGATDSRIFFFSFFFK